MTYLFLSLCFGGLFSCTKSPKGVISDSESYSYYSRDSIMRDYFKVLDSLPLRDTLHDAFILLKAYYKNDTTYLREHYNRMLVNIERWRKIDSLSCENPPPLHLSGCEEAYRFSYSAAFCDTLIDITVGKSENNFKVTVRLYKTDLFTGKCSLAKQFNKSIKQSVGEEFLKDIYYYDYWGMEEINDVRGLDGSSLLVYGYKKLPWDRYRVKGIYRWTAEETAIGGLFKKALDLSEVKVRCYRFKSS